MSAQEVEAAAPVVQVFLSHASADTRVVEWVAAQIEALGIRAYVAERDPRPGTVLAEKVKVNIDSSDAMLVLLTKDAEASWYVQGEIGAALQVDKPVFALVEQGLAPRTFAMLEGVEHIRFDPADLGASSATLIASLRALSEQRGLPPAPPVLTQPALQLQLSAQLQLTAAEVLLGLFLFAAVTGFVYLAVQSGTSGPGASGGV